MVLIIIIIWILLAVFNMWKLSTSISGSNVLESVVAIALSPLFTLMAIIIIFILPRWK